MQDNNLTKSKDHVSINYLFDECKIWICFGVVLMQWHHEVGKVRTTQLISLHFPCCRVPRSWLAETWNVFYAWNSEMVRHIRSVLSPPFLHSPFHAAWLRYINHLTFLSPRVFYGGTDLNMIICLWILFWQLEWFVDQNQIAQTRFCVGPTRADFQQSTKPLLNSTHK